MKARSLIQTAPFKKYQICAFLCFPATEKNSLTCTSEKVRLSQPALPIPTNKEIHVRTDHSSLYARVFICYIVFTVKTRV